MSSVHSARRQKPQELTLPSGKKIIVALPDDLDAVRQKYAHQLDTQVEVVVHGSPEHHEYLRHVKDHHEHRRNHLRDIHGAALDEWEHVHNMLSHVTSELEHLTRKHSELDSNFNKFGFDARLRTYDGENSGPSSSRASLSAPDSEDGDEPRLGATTKLFTRPVVKQWFHKGLLWRAADVKEIMAIELFFDLIYVAIIHTNGEQLTDEPTGHDLLRFVITFVMTWKIWSDVTTVSSWFENDDVFTRFEILFEIACLVGFTTNMINSFNEDPEHNTYTQLVAFYLTARLNFALYYGLCIVLLPMIRGVMIVNTINIIIPSILWIVSIHVDYPGRLALIFPALVLDLYAHSLVIIVFRFSQKHSESSIGKWLGKLFEFFPAMNIEHRVERMNAFVSLVLGYSVVAIIFQSNGGYNINAFLGKAILGLAQAFLFNWIYFDVDGRNINTHAIRRSISSATLWQFCHLPFIMGYIVATAGLAKLVLTDDVPNTNPEQVTESYRELVETEIPTGSRFFYCHGLAIALLSMLGIALAHDHRRFATLRVSKRNRIINRLIVIIILFLLPIATDLHSLQLIATTLGLTIWVLVVDIFGMACSKDPFCGRKKGDNIKYHARCPKKDYDHVMAGGSGEEERHSGEIFALGRNEKTAV